MSKGPLPYDDVYLDEQGSSEEDEGIVQGSPDSKPLISNYRKPKKSKIQVRHPKPKKASYYKKKRCCLKYFYLTLAIISVVLFFFVLVKVVHDALLGGRKNHISWGPPIDHEAIVPCSGFTVEPVWIRNLPTITTETAVRMVDVNRDGILDAILGFGTMVQGLFADAYLLCQVYYDSQNPCFGGLLALDGYTGDEIWRHYSPAEIFAVNCNEDMDLDGVKDCLGAGRAGQFELINGATGEQMWTFADKELVREYVSNLYTPQYIDDIDGDGTPDVINIHGGDPLREADEGVTTVAKVIIFSGRTGEILVWSEVPDKQESYYSPQVYTKGDGSKVFLFGTGGEVHGGHLYAVSLSDVTKGNLSRSKVLYESKLKGIMTPPVLADITNDGVVDIIMVPFNGSVAAINGDTFEIIWNVTVPYSESYSTPGAGYFNDDTVPDFMIVFNYGPGYPLYYYSQVTILDGRNGALLIDPPIISSGSVQSSSLAVSFEGWGNDAFIYWSLVCEGHEHETRGFAFAKDVVGGRRSRVNFCKERFGTDDVTKQFIINQNMDIPGDPIYVSSEYFETEHSNPVNATVLALKFLKDNPDVKEQVIEKALHGGHHGSKKEQKETPKATPPPPTPKLEEHPKSDVVSDDQLMDQFLSYLHDNFDPAERKKMIKQLLADTQEMDSVGQAGFDLDSETSENAFDLAERNFGDAGDIPERNFGGDYRSSSHPKTHHSASRQGDRRESYPRRIEDYLYGVGDTYPYQRPYKKDRRRREDDEELLRNIDEEWLLKRRRGRRHLGNHDAEGTQRLLATGSLAPPLDAESVVRGDSIDVIFPVYWFYPDDAHLVLPEEEECMKGYMDNEEQRMNPDNQFYGMDHDGFINHVEKICIRKENEGKRTKFSEDINPANVYPFNLDAGIMTVYRLRLTCRCDIPAEAKKSGRRCAKLLPYQEQRWPSYIGRNADSFFDP